MRYVLYMYLVLCLFCVYTLHGLGHAFPIEPCTAGLAQQQSKAETTFAHFVQMESAYCNPIMATLCTGCSALLFIQNDGDLAPLSLSSLSLPPFLLPPPQSNQ